jgi:hypothetical protein
MQYTIELTEEEKLSLEYVAYDPKEWIENCVRERCRIAKEEIVDLTVEKCLQNNIQVPGTKLDIIKLSYEQGWIKSAKDRTDLSFVYTTEVGDQSA